MLKKSLQGLIVILVISLVGCKEFRNKTVELSHDAWLDFEARFHDIFIPIDARPLSSFLEHSALSLNKPICSDNLKSPFGDEASSAGSVVAYSTSFTQKKLIALYIQEMEIQGWNLTSRVEGRESLLMFEKPVRSCAVVIRPDTGQKVYAHRRKIAASKDAQAHQQHDPLWQVVLFLGSKNIL